MTDAVNEYPTTETKSMSPWSMLVNVLFSPTRVFQAAKEKPKWVTPLIIILLFFMIFAFFMTPIAIKTQMEMLKYSDKYTQEQRDAMMQNAEMGQKFGQIIGVISAPIIWTIIIVVITGLLLLMGNVIFGGAARFVQILLMVCLSFVTWIISAVVKLPLMITKDTLDIRTSLALLQPSDIKTLESPLYSFLNTYTDVFVIWQIIILIIGVKVMYNFTTGRSAATVLIPTAVLALISVGVGMMF